MDFAKKCGLVSAVNLEAETQKKAWEQYGKGRHEAKPGWGLQECGVSKGQAAGEGDTSAES